MPTPGMFPGDDITRSERRDPGDIGPIAAGEKIMSPVDGPASPRPFTAS